MQRTVSEKEEYCWILRYIKPTSLGCLYSNITNFYFAFLIILCACLRDISWLIIDVGGSILFGKCEHWRDGQEFQIKITYRVEVLPYSLFLSLPLDTCIVHQNLISMMVDCILSKELILVLTDSYMSVFHQCSRKYALYTARKICVQELNAKDFAEYAWVFLLKIGLNEFRMFQKVKV